MKYSKSKVALGTMRVLNYIIIGIRICQFVFAAQ